MGIQHEADQIQQTEGVAAKPWPGLGAEDNAEVQSPADLHQPHPQINFFAALPQPHHQRDAGKGDGQARRHHIAAALAPVARVIGFLNAGHIPQLHIAQAMKFCLRTHHAHPHGLHIATALRGNRPPARHVPAARIGLSQRTVTPQQLIIPVHRACHANARNSQAQMRRMCITAR